MIKQLSQISVLALALTFSSCLKKDEFPIEPSITFKSFDQYVDAKGKDVATLTLGFTDGDGDIGVKDTSISNLFLRYYEKQNGKMVFRDLPDAFNYRVPDVTPTSKKKSVTGEISLDLTFYYDPFSKYDTIQYEVFVRDQAGHESNHVFTNEIIIPQ